MEHDPSALAPLKQRFALRLDAALDACGYPVRTPARVRALAGALGVEIPVATALLSGLHLPDYAELLALGTLLQQPPGYFLDEHVLEFPPGTSIVKPLLNGEDLVLRLPSELLTTREARRGLLYWRTTVPMGFGIGAGEYLIALAASAQAAAEPGRLYLLAGAQSVDVVRCTEVQSDRAMFQSAAAGEVAVMVPATALARGSAGLNRLVASVRCGASLHARS